MSKVIDSFLVSLGFDLDEKSEKETTAGIGRIKSTALGMGAVLSAALLGAGAIARSTARDIGEVYNSSKLLGSVGVSELDQYRHAFEQAGGSVEEAESQLAGFESLLANAKLGKGPFEDLENAGIPSELLTDTKTSIELFEKLSHIYSRLTDDQRKLAADALGLSRGADLLLREGPEQIQEWLRDAEKLGVISEKMGESAEKLNQASDRLGRAFDNLKNIFTESVSDEATAFTDGLTTSLVQFNDALEGEKSFDSFGPSKAVRSAARFSARLFSSPSEVLGEAAAGGIGSAIQPFRNIVSERQKKLNLEIESTWQNRLSPLSFPTQQNPLSNPTTTTINNNKLDKVEINIKSDSPEAAAEAVSDKLTSIFGMAEQQLKTGMVS